MTSFVIELVLWIIFSGYCFTIVRQTRKKRMMTDAIINGHRFYVRYMTVKKLCK